MELYLFLVFMSGCILLSRIDIKKDSVYRIIELILVSIVGAVLWPITLIYLIGYILSGDYEKR